MAALSPEPEFLIQGTVDLKLSKFNFSFQTVFMTNFLLNNI